MERARERPQTYRLLEGLVMAAVILLLIALTVEYVFALRARAERTAVEQTVAGLNAALQLAMSRAVIAGRWDAVAALDGANPMDLAGARPEAGAPPWEPTAPPRSYRGLLPASGVAEPGQWYFDPMQRELVYRPRFAEAGEAAERRFASELLYEDRDGDGRFRHGRDLLSGVRVIETQP